MDWAEAWELLVRWPAGGFPLIRPGPRAIGGLMMSEFFVTPQAKNRRL